VVVLASSDKENMQATEATALTHPRKPTRDRQIIYMPTAFLQGTLPYQDPGELAVWRRSMYGVSLHIEAANGLGLPFGLYPRLLLTWVISEVFRTGSPDLRLGRDVRAFAGSLGIENPSSGQAGSLTRLRDQMRRLFGAAITVMRTDDSGEAQSVVPIWQTGEGFWDEPIGSRLSLSDAFYREVTDHSAPLDLNCVHALRSSPLSLDLYAWLTWQFSFTSVPRAFTWAVLQAQFGSQAVAEKKFRELWKAALERVLIVYPKAKIDVSSKKIVLRPSPTSVPRAHHRASADGG
jgi:hypothetical protein